MDNLQHKQVSFSGSVALFDKDGYIRHWSPTKPNLGEILKLRAATDAYKATAASLADGHVYFSYQNGKSYLFHLQDNRLTTMPKQSGMNIVPAGIQRPAVVAVENKFFVIGGAIPQAGEPYPEYRNLLFDEKRLEASDMAFSTSEDYTSWMMCQRMGVPRVFAASAVLGESIFVLGGLTAFPRLVDSCARYDVAADRWRNIPVLPGGGFCGAAGAVLDGRVFVVGGSGGTVYPPNDGMRPFRDSNMECTWDIRGDTYAFDPRTGVWSTPEPMPNPVAVFTELGEHNGFALAHIDGSLYALVSERPSFKYDARANKWLQLSGLTKEPGSFVTAAVL